MYIVVLLFLVVDELVLGVSCLFFYLIFYLLFFTLISLCQPHPTPFLLKVGDTNIFKIALNISYFSDNPLSLNL